MFKEQKNPWVPYSPYVSKFNENREAPADEVVVELEDDYEDDDTFKKRQDSVYPYQADPSTYSSQIYSPGGRSMHSRQLYSNSQPQQQQHQQQLYKEQRQLPEEEEEEDEQTDNQANIETNILQLLLIFFIYRRFSRSLQLGGLWSVLDWRSHQGIRQSKLCYQLRK